MMINNSSSTASPNGTTMGATLSPSQLIGFLIAFSIVDVLIIVSNVVTIAVFTRSKLLRKRTNYFLLSLAVADIMVGTISLPMFLHTLVVWTQGGLAGLGEWVTILHKTLDIFTGFASVFALTIISLERLYSVALPNWHRTTPRYVYCLLIALIWTLAGVFVILRLLFDKKVITDRVLLYTMIVTFFVCLVVICLAYVGIWVKVRNRMHEKTKKAIEKDKRLAMTLLFVTATFIVTWLPFQGMNIIMPLCGTNCSIPPHLLFSTIYFAKLLQYTNSFVNPLIYTYKMPDFRRALLALMGTKSYRGASTKASSRMINERRRRVSTLRSSESEPVRDAAV